MASISVPRKDPKARLQLVALGPLIIDFSGRSKRAKCDDDDDDDDDNNNDHIMRHNGT
jgi:hypothetical protein